MSRRGVLAAAVAGAALAVAAFVAWPIVNGAASRGRVPQATIAVSEALGSGDLAGFARALGPRPFSFPDDHGPHPEFRTEWWYYTGNLETAAGRHVGFQLTFFRTALAPPDRSVSVAGASAWRANQLYLAHFALTDTAGGRFHAASRLGREALGLSGARAQPFRVWLEDWSAESEAPDGFPVRLRAADGDVRDRPRPRGRQARRAPGRPGMERERARAGQCVLLLLLHPYACARDRAGGRGVDRGLRPRLDGSRVEHERASSRPRRLGLARAPARRRARRHGLSAPPPRRLARTRTARER